MRHRHHLTSLGTLAALTLTVAAAAQQYTLSQPIGADTFGGRSAGQTITPSVGVTPDPGAQGVMQLTRFTMYRGNGGANAPSATTWLNVYLGDPNNGGVFIGSSDNSIDTTNLTFHDPMVWSFSQLPLVYTLEHWLVMSSSSVAGNLDIEVSLETAPRTTDPYPGGAGLIANIVPHPNGVDARFEALFYNGIIGSFTVSGTGCPGAAGQALLSSPSQPTVGRPLLIDVGNVAPGALVFLALGFSDTNWNGIPLPVALAAFFPGAAPACQLLIGPEATQGMPVAGATASLSLAVPNLAVLVGLRFFVQGAQLEPTGIGVTAKGTVQIGS